MWVTVAIPEIKFLLIIYEMKGVKLRIIYSMKATHAERALRL
jgi:hypothetical protein